MGRGALRGALTAAFGLLVLQAAVSQGGSGKIAGLLDVVNGLVQRAFDPTVPAIPDRRAGDTAPPASSTPAPAPASVTGPDSAGRWPSYNVPVPR